MPDPRDPAQHVKPYVHETLDARALHFSMGEIQSRMQLADPDALDLEYTRVMMGFLLFNPAPRDIAMIGLGGGSLAKFCHRHLPAARIRVVELNPHVIALRETFHVPPDSARFGVLQADGARFVRDTDERFDVLLADGFDRDGLPARLSSQRFYDDCFDVLRPGGFLVVNLHFGHARFELIVERIQRSFGTTVLIVDGVDLANSVLFAHKGPALEPQAPRALRAPRALDPQVRAQLADGFAWVRKAIRQAAR